MRPSWDETWLSVARSVARRSGCIRDRVGAVIVDHTNRIVATGYNGAPAGYMDGDTACTLGCERAKGMGDLAPDYSDCPSIHAEANALLFCDRREREGGTMYVTSAPCIGCAKLMANSGIARVVIAKLVTSVAHRDPMRSIDFMIQCQIDVTHHR